MGVYVKGMKMPQNCDECELNSTCIYSLHMPLYHTDKRGDECPIFEVQEPHGRLIDADALKENWCVTELGNKVVEVAEIDYAPTIIPASEEE